MIAMRAEGSYTMAAPGRSALGGAVPLGCLQCDRTLCGLMYHCAWDRCAFALFA